MNRVGLIRQAYVMPPKERASDVIAWASEIVENAKSRNLDDPMEEVFAIQRITQGLIDLANAGGQDLRERNWVDPNRDPTAALIQAREWAFAVSPFFPDPTVH